VLLPRIVRNRTSESRTGKKGNQEARKNPIDNDVIVYSRQYDEARQHGAGHCSTLHVYVHMHDSSIQSSALIVPCSMWQCILLRAQEFIASHKMPHDTRIVGGYTCTYMGNDYQFQISQCSSWESLHTYAAYGNLKCKHVEKSPTDF